jgi:hypothetical protein
MRDAAGLAYVCTHLDELRQVLHDDGHDAGSVLALLLAALRDGKPVAQPLEDVHQAVQRAGDELGIYGEHRTRSAEAVGVAPAEIVFRCPLGKCLGRSFDEVAQFPPHCVVNGAELVRDRLL